MNQIAPRLIFRLFVCCFSCRACSQGAHGVRPAVFRRRLLGPRPGSVPLLQILQPRSNLRGFLQPLRRVSCAWARTQSRSLPSKGADFIILRGDYRAPSDKWMCGPDWQRQIGHRLEKKQNKKHGRVSSQHHFLKVIKAIEGGGSLMVLQCCCCCCFFLLISINDLWFRFAFISKCETLHLKWKRLFKQCENEHTEE